MSDTLRQALTVEYAATNVYATAILCAAESLAALRGQQPETVLRAIADLISEGWPHPPDDAARTKFATDIAATRDAEHRAAVQSHRIVIR